MTTVKSTAAARKARAANRPTRAGQRVVERLPPPGIDYEGEPLGFGKYAEWSAQAVASQGHTWYLLWILGRPFFRWKYPAQYADTCDVMADWLRTDARRVR